ncbi:MAG: site-2 protease family protein [Pirellulales bacterium]
MIFQEPDRTQWDLNFRLFGVDVRVHPLFWIFSILISGEESPKFILVAVAAMFLSILIHEFGHVLAFRRYGMPSHIVLHAFGGLAIPNGMRNVYGSARRFSPAGSAFVAFAGPALEIAAAFLLLGLVYVAGGIVRIVPGGLIGFTAVAGFQGFEFLNLFINIFVQLSIIWGVLNLLPIIPLDGGRISEYLFDRYGPADSRRQAVVVSLITAILAGLYLFQVTRSLMTLVLFGYLAYVNFQALQSLSGGRRW